jgi:hypothetical protein
MLIHISRAARSCRTIGGDDRAFVAGRKMPDVFNGEHSNQRQNLNDIRWFLGNNFLVRPVGIRRLEGEPATMTVVFVYHSRFAGGWIQLDLIDATLESAEVALATGILPFPLSEFYAHLLERFEEMHVLEALREPETDKRKQETLRDGLRGLGTVFQWRGEQHSGGWPSVPFSMVGITMPSFHPDYPPTEPILVLEKPATKQPSASSGPRADIQPGEVEVRSARDAAALASLERAPGPPSVYLRHDQPIDDTGAGMFKVGPVTRSGRPDLSVPHLISPRWWPAPPGR